MNALMEKTTNELVARRDEVDRALRANRKYLASVYHELSFDEIRRQSRENSEMLQLVEKITEILMGRADYIPF